MKRKFAFIIIVIGIVASLGATRIKKAEKNSADVAQRITSVKPLGGFSSEDR